MRNWDNLKKGDKVRISHIEGGRRDQKKRSENPPYNIVGRIVPIVSRSRNFNEFMVKFEGRNYRFLSSEFVDPDALWIPEREFGSIVETWVDRDYDNRPAKVSINWAAIGPVTPKLAERFARQILSAVSYARRRNRQISQRKKEDRLARRRANQKMARKGRRAHS